MAFKQSGRVQSPQTCAAMMLFNCRNKIIAPIVAVSHVLLSERQHPLGHAKPDGENDE